MADALKDAKAMAKYNNTLMLSNAKQAQKFNAQEAEKTRDWQEDMANTAHQREMKDLKKAGLNPVLSAKYSGSDTPSGATASGEAADVDTSLTNGILQMAMNQMNNATSMQRTAMETQNALMIAQLNNATSWREHVTPGGSTTLGQIMYGLGVVDELLTGNSARMGDTARTINNISDILTKGKGTVDKEVAKWDYYKKHGKMPTKKQLNAYMYTGGISLNQKGKRTVYALTKGQKKERAAVKKSKKKTKKKTGYTDKYGSFGSIFRKLFS